MKSVERFADRKMRETYPDYVSQRDVVLEPVGLSENDLSYLPLSEYEVSSARASAYAAKAQQLELERGLFLSSYKKDQRLQYVHDGSFGTVSEVIQCPEDQHQFINASAGSLVRINWDSGKHVYYNAEECKHCLKPIERDPM